jgi:hypothetical protein
MVPLRLLQSPTTVGKALNRDMIDGTKMCVLTGISMHHTMPTASACSTLVAGIELFSPLNLLSETDAVNSNNHHRLQLSIGSRGSHLKSTIEPYGVDVYSYLVEGEKLWYLAPPECESTFRELFDGRAPLDVSEAELKAHQRVGIVALHQRAGDAVYIPGGWISIAQSITATVSFGSAYLRAWKLTRTLDYAERAQQCVVEKEINIRGIFGNIEEEAWGIAAEEQMELRERYQALIDRWDQEVDSDDEDE